MAVVWREGQRGASGGGRRWLRRRSFFFSPLIRCAVFFLCFSFSLSTRFLPSLQWMCGLPPVRSGSQWRGRGTAAAVAVFFFFFSVFLFFLLCSPLFLFFQCFFFCFSRCRGCYQWRGGWWQLAVALGWRWCRLCGQQPVVLPPFSPSLFSLPRLGIGIGGVAAVLLVCAEAQASSSCSRVLQQGKEGGERLTVALLQTVEREGDRRDWGYCSSLLFWSLFSILFSLLLSRFFFILFF